MYSFLQSTHSYFAYLLLAILILSLVMAFVNKSGKKPFQTSTKKYALFGLIAAHLQLVMGLVLYIISPLGLNNLSGSVMQDSFGRLMAVEHPLTMIIGILLITVGYSKAKRAISDAKAYSAITIYYTIGLLLILSRIPWQTWFN